MDILTDINALDIEKAFAESFESAKQDDQPSRDSFPYSAYNACGALGKVYCRVIPSISRGKLIIYKALEGVMMGRIPFDKDNGDGTYNRTIRVIPNNEYICELTDEQKEFNNKLINELNRYNDLSVSHGMEYAPIKTKRVTMFYGFIRRLINDKGEKTDYSDPMATCIYFTSKGFSGLFNEAIKNKTEAKESNKWLSEYFNRNPEETDKLVLITTSRPEIKYEHSISFDEYPALKFTIKKEDLDTAIDLDEAFVNTKSYDMEFYKPLYDRVKQLNDEMEDGPVFKDHEFGGDNLN